QGAVTERLVVTQGRLVGAEQATDTRTGRSPRGGSEGGELIQPLLAQGAARVRVQGAEQAELVEGRQIEDQLADRDADLVRATLLREDSVREILDREMRICRDRHKRAECGIGGWVHGSPSPF